MKLKKNIILLAIFGLIVSASCGGKGGTESGSGKDKTAPPVPSGISATRGEFSDKVEVKWDKSEGAESYVIYKSIDDRNKFVAVIAEVEGTSYTDEKVTPNRYYYYKVAAASGSSWSDPSTDALGFAHSGKPMVPETVTVSSNEIGKITLSWSAVPQTDSFKVTRSDSEDGTYTEIAAGITSTTYTDSDAALVRDRKYYYKIISVSTANGESEPGNAITGCALQDIPLPPSGIEATDGFFKNKVKITWSKSALAVTYNVYKSTGGIDGNYTKIGNNISGNDITGYRFEDADVIDDVDYYYSVSAVSSGGESATGTPAKGTIDPAQPSETAMPVNVTASQGNYDTVTITWDAVPDAAGYSVYRCATIGGTYELIAASDKTTEISFIDTAPPALVTHYFYKVKSWSAGLVVSSDPSAPAEGYAMPQKPAVPTGITASDRLEDATISITCPIALRADSYKIYRAEDQNGPYNLIASGIEKKLPADTSVTYIDTLISAGRAYYYKVSAFNISGESDMSTTGVMGISILAVPAKPSLTLASDKSNITISWNRIPGATSYKIQRSKVTPGWSWPGEWSDLITVTDISYSDTNISKSNRYWYRVEALNVNNTPITESGYSEQNYKEVPLF